jgi:hypothetical protein
MQVTTLSILFFNACPKKSLKELFPVTRLPMSRAKEEMKSMVGSLLVVTVLVAGVTFAGAIQLPQLRDKNNSSEFNSTYENLLCGYLFLDVGALSTSLVAALILLWSNFNYPRYQIPAVQISTSMVCLAIIMMFGAFFFSVRIALLGSHGGLLTIIVEVVAVMFFFAQACFVFPWIIPLNFNYVLLQVLLHNFYYSLFLLFIYSSWWLPNKLSDLKRKHHL